MDYVQVGIVVGLLLLGAGAVYWPLSIALAWKDEQLDELRTIVATLKADANRAGEAADSMVVLERELGDARGLGAANELRLHLDDDPPGPEAPSRTAGGRHRRES